MHLPESMPKMVYGKTCNSDIHKCTHKMITLFNLHKMHKDTVYPPEGWAFPYLLTEHEQPNIVLQCKTSKAIQDYDWVVRGRKREREGDRTRERERGISLVIEKISHLATFCTKQIQKKNNGRCEGSN